MIEKSFGQQLLVDALLQTNERIAQVQQAIQKMEERGDTVPDSLQSMLQADSSYIVDANHALHSSLEQPSE
jgi:hypothetical protein